jgi:hypothetical protein
VGNTIAVMTQGDGGTLFRAKLTGVGLYIFGIYGTVACLQIGATLPQPVATGAQVWNYGT